MSNQCAQLGIGFEQELVVDLFAGGGGASLGIARAYREPDIAVNHNPTAIAVHTVNHPTTTHLTCDVFEVDPVQATGGRPVGVLWASPDCRHHSKAKGGKPRSKKIRGLAWVVIKWAAAVKPREIHLENVEEFADWGPLLKDGSPCKIRKGLTFRRWVRQLENAGYKVEWRELVAADFGAPTIRKRLYVTARCDGRPIVWPAPTHAKKPTGHLKPWRTAAECIDFDRPAKSIFGRKKRLAMNTERRIAKGLWRYVLTAAEPFIVSNIHHNGPRPVSEPLSTLLTGNHKYLAEPVLIQAAHGEGKPGGVQRWGIGSRDVKQPLGTITASGGHAVAAAHLTALRGTTEAHLGGDDVAEPLGTVTGQGTHHALIAAHITKFRANSIGSGIDEPLHTITAGGNMARPAGAAHALGLVSAHLTRQFGKSVGSGADEPVGTIVAGGGGKTGVVAAHLTAFGQNAIGSDLQEPADTVMAGAPRYGVVSAFMEQANGGFYDGQGRSIELPMSTVTAAGSNQQLINAYLIKYYREGGQWQGCKEPMHTIPTKARMGLVEVVQVNADILAPELLAGARACAAFLHEHLPQHFPEPADLVLVGDYVLVDITLRMLVPRELARAQGFPDSYIIEHGPDGKAITKTDQVRLIGNSVCPDVAEAIVRANAADLIRLYAREAQIA